MKYTHMVINNITDYVISRHISFDNARKALYKAEKESIKEHTKFDGRIMRYSELYYWNGRKKKKYSHMIIMNGTGNVLSRHISYGNALKKHTRYCKNIPFYNATIVPYSETYYKTMRELWS